MKRYDKTDSIPYQFYSSKIENISELVDFEYPSTYFVLFLAANFNKIQNKAIFEIAKKLINRGLVYICTWGPGCEKAQDAIDLANVMWEKEQGKEFLVMSTSHKDESIDEALWFAIFLAIVGDEFWNECSTIAVTIEQNNWAQQIEANLCDVAALNEKVVNE